MSVYQEEYTIPDLIDDTIQSLKFFPSKEKNILSSGGFDSKLRFFDINYQLYNSSQNAKFESKLVNIIENPSPILSLSFGNNLSIFTGCSDGSINFIDLNKNSLYTINKHNSGCKEVVYINDYNLLISGGWDGNLKLIDLRNGNVVSNYQFDNKIYSVSYNKNLLVVGMSQFVLAYFDLTYLQKGLFRPEIVFKSHLNEHIRKVVVFSDGKKFAEASIEGRVAIKNVNLNQAPKLDLEFKKYSLKGEEDFAFKAHREQINDDLINYQINDMCVNPIDDTLCTVGGDSAYRIWDINKKSKITERPKELLDKIPLTSCDINQNGNILAIASGYDWSLGANSASNYPRPKISLRYLKDKERYYSSF